MRVRNTRGSVTVEASISLIVFMFLMVTLLSFINISRLQHKMSAALSRVTLEISQYMYLYERSGLYDFEMQLQAAGKPAQEAGETLLNAADNGFVGIEAILASVSQAGQSVNPLPTNLDDLNASTEQLKQLYEGTSKNTADISAAIDSISSQSKEIGENPIKFVKSLAALGISTGMDMAKSYLIGNLLAKNMIVKYLGAGAEDSSARWAYADAYLRNAGVKDGMDGLNFGASYLFRSDAPQDINIIVVYDVALATPFWEFEMTFAQSASTRAWLGGNKTKTYPKAEPEPPSLWDIDDPATRGSEGKALIMDVFLSEFKVDSPYSHIAGYNAATNTFYNTATVELFSDSYRNADGSLKVSAAIQGALNNARNTQSASVGFDSIQVGGTEWELDHERARTIEIWVVVPENISPEEYTALQQALNEKADEANRDNAANGENSTLQYVVQRIGHSKKGD